MKIKKNSETNTETEHTSSTPAPIIASSGEVKPIARRELLGGDGYWLPGEKMNGKQVIYRVAKTIITFKSEPFQEKLLCDGIVFGEGDSCAFSCTFCYVEDVMRKIAMPLIKEYNQFNQTELVFQDFVIRRHDPLEIVKWQLLHKNGTRRYDDPNDNRVVYSSTLVDVAGNKTLLQETADVCNLILEHTNWQIRLLSKNSILKDLVAKEMIPKLHHQRLIFGFSTGTLNNDLALAIEKGTASVKNRLKALHWLQDNGYRTFGMICPSLPQEDYDAFSKAICEAIRVEKCEHVWAEVINVRGESMTQTVAALREAGLEDEVARLEGVSGPGHQKAWEKYARDTFEAHARNIPPEKLRFLQYVDPITSGWWSKQRDRGAILIGSVAQSHGLTSAPSHPNSKQKQEPAPTAAEKKEFSELDEIVRKGAAAFIQTGEALAAIKAGRLWRAGNYVTWDLYCQSALGMDRSQSDRLIRASANAKLVKDEPIGPEGATLTPRSESQIRALSSLRDDDAKIKAWSLAVEKAEGGQPTALLVKAAVQELAPVAACPSPKRPLAQRMAEVYERFQKGVKAKSWDEVEKCLIEIGGLLGLADCEKAA